ncbi:hypothetical protein Tco_1066339 [Tanacetum coccineum]|uniref:Uncharacterized protein n=1 Tax=Tanacetum coccineum TaxID=301880 RepID=A0ABQ5HBJ7_9ASTR
MANLQSSQQEPQTPPTNPAQSSLESSQTPIPFEPATMLALTLRKSSSIPTMNQPSASTLVVAELHKEALQATNGQTSLGVTHEERTDAHLITTFTAEADLGNIDPKDSFPLKQGTNKGTINYSFDHIITGTNPSVLVDKTKSARDGCCIKFDDDDEIKWADLTELVQERGACSMDLESFEDDQPLQVSNNYETEVQTKTKDNSVAAKAEAANLRALPSYPNVQQLIELLVNSLKPEFDLLIKDHDFSSHIPSELKELPTKFGQVIETLGFKRTSISVLTTKVASLEGLKLDIQAELVALLAQVSSINSQLAKLKVLDAIPTILGKVVALLDRFADAVSSTSQRVGDLSVPLAGQAGPHLTEGNKNTN